MDRTKAEVIKSIRRYKETGKLPTEYDVVRYAPEEAYEDEAPNYIENIGAPVPYTSPEAETLAEGMDVFLGSLTGPQKKVYDFHVIGGLTLTEVSRILGVAVQTVAAHVDNIRDKAKAVIDANR